MQLKNESRVTRFPQVPRLARSRNYPRSGIWIKAIIPHSQPLRYIPRSRNIAQVNKRVVNNIRGRKKSCPNPRYLDLHRFDSPDLFADYARR